MGSKRNSVGSERKKERKWEMKGNCCKELRTGEVEKENMESDKMKMEYGWKMREVSAEC